MNSLQNHTDASFARRSLWPVWIAAFFLALILYRATMAPGLVWQDSADAQVRVALDDWRGPFALARSHVLQFLLASGLRHALDADPARTANLLSVIAGALAVANIAALLSLLLRSNIAVFAAAAMLALSHTLWQFSTMAESYSLAAALFSAELLLLALFERTRRGRFLWLLGLANGLALANHNLALISLACYAIIALITVRRWAHRYARDVALAATLWLVGFAPLGLMIVADLYAGNGIGPVFRSMLVGDNAEQVFNLRLGLSDLARFVAMIGLNFPTPLLLCVFLGWKGFASRIDRRLRWTYALLLIAHALFVARYNIVDQFSFMIPTCLMLALFCGAGIDWFLNRLALYAPVAPQSRKRAGAARALLACLPIILLALPAPLVYAILPNLLRRFPPERVPIPTRPVPYRDAFDWFLQPWHARYNGAHRFATEALALLPPDAVVLSDSTLRSPLLYLQNNDGIRRDVRIGFGTLQPFLEFRKIVGDDLRPLIRDGRLYSLTGQARYLGGNRWIAQEFRLEPTGPIFKVVPRP